jgi:redox-sensitive bicupin YhaK (pirin superfamily)
MFSGHFIQHQELNRSYEFARVIQIWYVAEPEFMGLPAHYEQVGLEQMAVRHIGDAVVRDIIGSNGATDAHVHTRLTSAILPANGQATIEMPQTGEELFLYFVDGNGRIQHNAEETKEVNLYDVVLAKATADTAVLQAGDKPLNYLSFYLKPFMAAATI